MLDRRGLLKAGGALAAGGVLAACGSDTGRGDGGGGGKPTLRQWYHQYGEAGVQQAVERYAKAYSDATVDVLWKPGDYNSQLASGLLSSAPPDTFEWQLNIDLVRGKQIVPLDDVIADAKSDFTPATLGLATVDDHVYGIPMIEDMQLLYYRKSLLAKAGVQPPQSVDELLAAARALTTKSVKGLFVGNDGGVAVLGSPAMWCVGADYPTDASWSGFGDTAQSLAKLRQLFTSGSLLLGAPADWSDPSAFTNGLCAMQWTGLWTLPAMQKAFGDDVGVAPFPILSPSAKPSVPIGTWNAFVTAKSKDIDAAKAFVKWLWITKTDFQLDFAQSYGVHIPTRKSVAAKADKLKSGVAADILNLSNQYAKAAGPPAWTPKMSTAYSDVLNRTIKAGADPAAQLAAAEKVVMAELARLF